MNNKSALDVKSLIVRFMNEKVYRGDYENPREQPDAAGLCRLCRGWTESRPIRLGSDS